MADFIKDGSKIFVKYTGHEQETAHFLGSRGILTESDVNICYNLYGGIKSNKIGSVDNEKKHKKNDEINVKHMDLFIIFLLCAGAFVGLYFLIKSYYIDNAIEWLFDSDNKIHIHTWNHWWYLGMDEITINQSCFTLLTGLRIHPLLFIIQVVAGLAECLWWLLTAILWLLSWIILGGGGCILYGLPGIICFFSICTATDWFKYSSKNAKDIIVPIIFILISIGETIFTYFQLFI